MKKSWNAMFFQSKMSQLLALLLAVAIAFFAQIEKAASQTFRVLDLKSRDLCFSAAADRLFVAVPGDGPTGNAVFVLDPATGATLERIPCGSEPEKLAVSADGKMLFIGLLGQPVLRRFDLENDVFLPDLDLTDGYTVNGIDYFRPIHAKQIVPFSNAPNSFLLATKDPYLSPEFVGANIFDGSQRRPNGIGGIEGSNSFGVSPSGTRAWGIDHPYDFNTFDRYDLSAQGMSIGWRNTSQLGSSSREAVFSATRAYLFGGQVYDLAGDSAVLLTTLDLGQIWGFFRTPLAVSGDGKSLFSISSWDSNQPGSFGLTFLNRLDTASFLVQKQDTLPVGFSDEISKMVWAGGQKVAFSAAPFQNSPQRIWLFDPAPCPPQNLNLPSVGPLFGCVGDTLEATAAAGYASYFWSNGATTRSQKLTASASGLSYRVLGPNGCLSEPSPAANFIFEARPEPPFIQYPNWADNVICPDEKGQFFPYQWPHPARYVVSTGDTILPEQYSRPMGPGRFSVKGQSQNGCESAAAFGEFFNSVPNAAKPVLQVVGDLTTCSNLLPELIAPADAASYLWSNGATTRSIRPPFSGNYSVKLGYENTCFGPSSDTISVKIDFSPTPLSIYESFFQLKVDDPFAASIADSVRWFRNGQLIAGASGATFSPTEQGIYQVKIFDGPCAAMSQPYGFNGECRVELEAEILAGYIEARALPDHNYSYLWDDGSQSVVRPFSTAGQYCVIVTRFVDGCTATKCLTIEKGKIRAFARAVDGTTVKNTLLILSKQTFLGSLEVIDTLESDANGEAIFERNFGPEPHTIQAVPKVGTTESDLFLPTFWLDKLLWNEANFFFPPKLAVSDEPPLERAVYIRPAFMQLGPGGISGIVQQIPGFWSGGSGDASVLGDGPIANAQLLLFSANGQVAMCGYTDQNGAFSFENLPFGTYFLYLNLNGVPVIFATIVIGPGSPTANGIVFSINSAGATVDVLEVEKGATLKMWPVPTDDFLFFESSENGSWQLFDAVGRLILDGKMTEKAAQKIDLKGQPDGAFWLRATGASGAAWLRKAVKIER